jgi:hypothetical protein
LSNFFGATTNVEKFSIAQKSADGVIVDIAVSTEELDGFISSGDTMSTGL